MKKQFTPKEKAAVAIEAIKGIKTAAQIGSEYQAHPVAVGTWKKQLLENSPKIFSEKQERDDKQKTIDELYRIIGEKDAQLAWIKKNLVPLTRSEKLDLIEKDNLNVPLKFQAEFLKLSRFSLYYQKAPVSEADINLMNLIDEIYTECPFYGARRIKKVLKRKYEIIVSRPHVRRLMKLMGIEAIYPKPNTSKPNRENKTYPYLLKNVNIGYPNQVWGTDITYIKLRKGFCYLVAIMDWFSRYVVAWELSNSLEIDFVLSNLKEALKTAKPQIHNLRSGQSLYLS